MLDLKDFSIKLSKELPKIKEKFDFSFLNTAGGFMQNRVFQKGESTTGQIGQYSETSKKIREAKGLQTAYVDLEFSGELRKSIKTGQSKGETVYGIEEITYIDGQTTVEVANKNRERFGQNILEVSDEEINEAFDGAIQAVSKDIDRAIEKALG